MEERRAYIKKAFQMYLTHKQQLFAWEEELKNLPIPGQSGLDYSKESVAGGGGNGVEAQFAQYADKCAELKEKIAKAQKKVDVVRRTIEHFKVESRAEGNRYYEYICARWLRRMSSYHAAAECGIAERTADFWIEKIFNRAEAIADEYELW